MKAFRDRGDVGSFSLEDFNRVVAKLPQWDENKPIRWRAAPQVVDHFHGVNQSRGHLGLAPLLWDDFIDRFLKRRDLFD
jgi:hypothetical protein